MTAPHADQAAELDTAHTAWSQMAWSGRTTFGTFAVDFLRERGIQLVSTAASPPAPLTPESGLPQSPFVDQALAMSVEEVADLLAALADGDLHWDAGGPGQCGVLHEGQPEPPDLHVVFDRLRAAWQRDDQRAAKGSIPAYRWFGPNGARRPWPDLRHDLGPLTPESGIAPTTPIGAESDDL